MQCGIVKQDYECGFATADGCGFGASDETCNPVVEACEGCDHTHEWPTGTYCTTFANPAAKWAGGICNFATHQRVEIKMSKQLINPLKAAKKAAKGAV